VNYTITHCLPIMTIGNAGGKSHDDDYSVIHGTAGRVTLNGHWSCSGSAVLECQSLGVEMSKKKNEVARLSMNTVTCSRNRKLRPQSSTG
jgi:hypothetical protein